MPARPIWWLVARERAGELGEGEQGRVIMRLLAHVEDGWAMVAELAGLTDNYPPPPRKPTQAGEMMARLLGFVGSDVVELFTGLAFTCSTMVPVPWDIEPEYPNADEVEIVGERFSRNVLMVYLASSDPIIPDVSRETLRRVSGDLLEWLPDFSVLAVAAARLGTDGNELR